MKGFYLRVSLLVLLASLLLALWLMPPAQAQETSPTTPHLSSMHLWLTLDQPACMERAKAALTAAGLILHNPVPTAQGGSNERIFVIITCMTVEKQTLVIVSVAGSPGNKNETVRTREFLGEFMNTGKAPDGGQTPTSNQHITLAKSIFTINEDVEVQWANLPGSPGPKGDWMTIVPVGSSDDTWGIWWFAEGKKTGTYKAGKLKPGKYEVRVYFNWPAGGYKVQSRLPFTVVTERTADVQAVDQNGAPPKQLIILPKSTFASTEEVVVQWTGLPGSPGPKGDWITIVPAGSPDDTWGNWWYTEGKKDGSRNFGKQKPGKYEVRVYFNWPDGGYTVQSRFPFTVQ